MPVDDTLFAHPMVCLRWRHLLVSLSQFVLDPAFFEDQNRFVGVVELDAADRVVWANQTLATQAGTTVAALVGQPLMATVPQLAVLTAVQRQVRESDIPLVGGRIVVALGTRAVPLCYDLVPHPFGHAGHVLLLLVNPLLTCTLPETVFAPPEPPHATPPATCGYCQTPLTRRRPWHRFCGQRCRQAAFWARHRRAMIAS